MTSRLAWMVAGLTAVCSAAGCGRSASIARPPEVAPELLPSPPPSQLGARIEVPLEALRAAALRQAGIETVPMTLKDTTITLSISPRDAGRASEFFITLPVEVAETKIVDRLQQPAGFVLRRLAPLDPLRLGCANLRPFVETVPIVGGVVKTACYVRSEAVIVKTPTKVLSYSKRELRRLVDDLPASSVADVSLAANARLESVDLRMEGDQITATAGATLAARVDGSLPFAKAGIVSCGFGETRPELRLTISARIGLDPSGDVVIREKAQHLDWSRPCGITAADVNFASLLQTLGLHRHVEDAINGVLARVTTRVSLQSLYATIWDSLRVPRAMPLDSLSRDSVWVALDPQAVQLQSVEGRGGSIVSGVQLTARPRLIVGPRPAMDTTRFTGVQVGSVSGDFRMRVTAQVSRAVAVRRLTDAMRASPLSTPLGAVRIDSVDIYSSGTATVLALNLRSPFKGWIYLTGRLAVLTDSAAALALSDAIATPTVVQAGSTPISVDLTASYRLIFDDLQFTTETQNALVNVADWVAHDPIRRLVQQRAQIPLSPFLARALARVPTGPVAIGRVAEASFRLDGVRPVGVHIDTTTITALLDAVGSASVRVIGSP